ncbi:Mu transposase domain-containing protein [Anaerovoracaceae bacterium SGI.195]
MAKLPVTRYELSEWASATVLFNYHISYDEMLYSVPYEHIRHKVNVWVTAKTVEVFYKQEHIASHKRLYGLKGQYSTVTDHMPQDHQKYLEWNVNRFRS